MERYDETWKPAGQNVWHKALPVMSFLSFPVNLNPSIAKRMYLCVYPVYRC
jgi:hypothetical protein